jgi:hypothetical protein
MSWSPCNVPKKVLKTVRYKFVRILFLDFQRKYQQYFFLIMLFIPTLSRPMSLKSCDYNHAKVNKHPDFVVTCIELWRHNTQHEDTQLNDIQHNNTQLNHE